MYSNDVDVVSQVEHVSSTPRSRRATARRRRAIYGSTISEYLPRLFDADSLYNKSK